MSDRVPIIADTDIGTNIDDVLALVYLLRQPLCELVAVTIAGGDLARRGDLARAILRAEGRGDIPVVTEGAVDLLDETIRRRASEITGLTIGPLTTMARLFERDPSIGALLRGLASMAGSFGDPPPEGRRIETNAASDPRATASVLEARVGSHGAPDPAHVIFPLDVTMRLRMDEHTFRRRIRPFLAGAAAETSDAWFRGRDLAFFHDPLAAAAIFEPEICRYEAGRAGIDLDREPGRTTWTPGGTESGTGRPPHRRAVDVAPERFFGHYERILRG
ncbi:MAG: nucleoside hydrolase [Planctomycetes bacterium]|nr:nucleoside hydrolase [Planctomycetota bacterium]